MKTETFLSGRIEYLDKNNKCAFEYRTPLETIHIHGIGNLTEHSSTNAVYRILDMIRIQARNMGVVLKDNPADYIWELRKKFV